MQSGNSRGAPKSQPRVYRSFHLGSGTIRTTPLHPKTSASLPQDLSCISPPSVNFSPASTTFILIMTLKGHAKTVQAVDSKAAGKSAGTKRATGGSSLEPRTKRQKTKSTTVDDPVMPEVVKDPVETWAANQEQVFRFMDLPGELRNRIYGMAAEWSHRCFPMTHRKPKRSRLRKQIPHDEDLRAVVKPLPYIALTQVCSLVRTEFRPLWLSTHRFPFFALESYFKAFFPVLRRTSQIDDKTRRRIESYYDPAGTLRVWVKEDCIRDIDILPLLKFRHRFPAYTISFVPGQLEVQASLIKFLTTLINNTSFTWVKYIKQQSITQVVLYAGLSPGASLHVVIKQRQMSEWVEPGGHSKPLLCTDLLRSLGVADLGCVVRFGVNYW